MDKIEQYISLIQKWNESINLIQKNSLKELAERHINDSLQIADFIPINENVVDIGSGAGFPGMILGILGYKHVVLAEKNFKKATFLLKVKATLQLNNVEIFNNDIRNFNRRNYICVSRAFGSVTKLLTIMEKIHAKRGIFHKGENYKKELIEAQKLFDFSYHIKSSVTNKNSAIIDIQQFRRK